MNSALFTVYTDGPSSTLPTVLDIIAAEQVVPDAHSVLSAGSRGLWRPVGTHASSWSRPSKVRLSTRSRAISETFRVLSRPERGLPLMCSVRADR